MTSFDAFDTSEMWHDFGNCWEKRRKPKQEAIQYEIKSFADLILLSVDDMRTVLNKLAIMCFKHTNCFSLPKPPAIQKRNDNES
mmetsp:Transcript_6514/g.15793  ORF Transcript_6514/g.15793 Transcript_6514/m.15793 type:complete len:84 (+) Transcript_6514:233-484(+)